MARKLVTCTTCPNKTALEGEYYRVQCDECKRLGTVLDALHGKMTKSRRAGVNLVRSNWNANGYGEPGH